MARNRYELAAVGEGQAPRKTSRKPCGPCPVWVWVLLVLVLLLLVAAAVGSYFVRMMVMKNTIYPVDVSKLYLGGDGITEGDMFGVNTSASDSAAKDAKLLWPHGRIPYRLDDELGCPDSPRCEVLMSAMEAFNGTCLVWEPARDSAEHAVSIELEPDGGCYSSVGYRGTVGGEQKIVLGRGCFNIGIILHQMGHTVGFWHEHNRDDRDQWVKVHLENTDDPDSFEMYDKARNPVSDSLDFQSVMMYGPDAFSNGNGSTMTSYWQDRLPLPELTNKTALSDQDVARIQFLYVQQCRDRGLSNAGS